MTKNSTARLLGLVLALSAGYIFFAPLIAQDGFLRWLGAVATVVGLLLAIIVGMALLIFGWLF